MPDHFQANSLKTPASPWFYETNLCLPNTTRNFPARKSNKIRQHVSSLICAVYLHSARHFLCMA